MGSRRISRWGVCLAGVLSCFTWLGATVRAQPSAGQSREYRELVQSAIAERDAARYSEAYALFKRAHALSPNARTLRGMGVVAFELGLYVQTLEHLRASLADARQPLDAGQRRETEALIARAEGYVARYTLHVQPSAATLRVDGVEVAPPVPEDLVLNPGRRVLELSAPGFRRRALTIDALSGEQRTLEIVLDAEPASAPAAEPSHEVAPRPTAEPAATTRAADQGGGGSIAPYVLAIGGGALLAGALVTGLVVQAAESDLEQGCSQGDCPPDLRATRSRGETAQVLTNVFLLAGGASLASGVVWWLVTRDDASPETARASGASCSCGPHGCAVSYAGVF